MYLLEKNFENATEEDLEELKRYFKAYQYRSSGHSFTSMFMWGPEYNASWEVIDGYLWTISSYQNEKGEEIYYSTMPLTLGEYEEKRLNSSIKKMKELMAQKGKTLLLYQVPNHLIEILKRAWGELSIESDRDSADYVYDRRKMENLSGRALHKKKNNLNSFVKNYEYVSEDLKEEDIQEALTFAESFNEEKNSLTKKDAMVLKNETEAIRRALGNRREYIARVIKMEGKIQALTIGAIVTDEEAVEHIEKANPAYRGLFQLVAVEFARNLPQSIEYINREEDMGIAKLRSSKEAYQPIKMYEKSTVILR